MKNIYFIVKNKNAGSTLLRAFHIISALPDNFRKVSEIVELKNIRNLTNTKNSIIIWIGHLGYKYINLVSKYNYHILDIVDKYLFNKNEIIHSLNNNIYNRLIVNNIFMKDYFQSKTNFKGNISIIYHHWDNRFSITKTLTNDKLVFGYMGSIKSLLHTDNFLHYKTLVHKYPIIFFDTEIGKDVTTNVINNNINYNIQYTRNNIPNKIQFNCDINIRDPMKDVSKFKTSAKIATSAALGHNIITTYDEAVKDILPENYPFILKGCNINECCEMFELVIKDYYSSKILWNNGLKIMQQVKQTLNIDKVANKYIEIFNKQS